MYLHNKYFKVILPIILFCSFLKIGNAEDNSGDILRNFLDFSLNMNKIVVEDKYDMRNFVSIAPLNESLILLANYKELFIFNKKTRSIQILSAIWHFNPQVNMLGERKYNPTGVCLGKNGTVYVANYKGDNILFGKIDIKKRIFNIYGEFYSINTRGPENLSLNAENSILVSANYDAGTVVAFDLPSGRELWSTVIGQAHGVCIYGDKVYVTGLVERKIYELDLQSGNILRSVGKLGWNPGNNEFLWPTSVSVMKNGNLIIADAHTGYISIMDHATMQVSRYFGGNGPSLRFLAYPYVAIAYDRDVVISNARRNHFIFLDSDCKQVVASFTDDTRRWPEIAYTQKEPFGNEWDGYVNRWGATYSLFGKKVNLGYGKLKSSDGKEYILRNYNIVGQQEAHFYFLQGIKGYDYNLFFSPSSSTLIYLSHDDKGLPFLWIENFLTPDSWNINGNIVSKNEIVAKDAIVKKIKKKEIAYLRLLKKNGFVDKRDLFKFFCSSDIISSPYVDFDESFDKIFSSNFGRNFKLIYDRFLLGKQTLQQLHEAARMYYALQEGEIYIYLDEYCLVGMLTGIAPRDAQFTQEQPISYFPCSDSRYYAGFGPEALSTPSLHDYLSAESRESSSICFRSSFPGTLQGLDVVWYDAASAAKALTVQAVDEKGIGTQISVPCSVSTAVGGFATCRCHIGALKSSVYRVSLPAGTQQRLILRGLSPVFIRKDANTSDLASLWEEVSVISAMAPYGGGLEVDSQELADQEKLLASLQYADFRHSGNYCLMFGLRNKGRYIGRIVPLYQQATGARHAIVEVESQSGQYVVDPMLGCVYRCNLNSMIAGECPDYTPVPSLSPPFLPFYGAAFFYRAKVVGQPISLPNTAAH